MREKRRQDTNVVGGRITMALAGDVMLGRLVNDALDLGGPRYPWGDTLPLLRQADLTLINLECVIASRGRPWIRTPKVFHFRASPVGIAVLQAAGVDYVSLANNHVLDYEEEALLEMLDRLDAAGIARAGAGHNLAEASAPAVLEASGVRIGVLSFTDNEPVWLASETRPGINYLPALADERYFGRVRQGIAEARRRGADLVVLSNHWGPNMRVRPTPEFRRFAHAAVDAGVDIYVGHSAHVLQGVEIYGGKPIFYDAGDFVDDYAVEPQLRNDLSALFLLTVGRQGVERIEAVPTAIDFCQVNLAAGPEFDWVAERLRLLSGEMGTDIVRKADRLEVATARAAAA
ncbi:MAG: CapA family protein [Dehalococcoidales bacterium]|nr:CapA family protein [Dehalococcoidales bacterium]